MCVIEEVLKTKIKNLEPVFYQTLLNRYSNDDYVKTLNKGKLLSYVRNDIGVSKLKNELCDIIINELKQYDFPTHNLLKYKPYFKIKDL